MNEGGLLGILGLSSGDANKDAAISHGLLQAGLSLLGARGRLGPALGQAGMVGLQGMQQYGQNQFQQTLQKAQLDELKRKQDMQQRGDAFRDSLVSPQMQASQGALAAGGGPTMANAQKMPAVDPGHQMLFDAVKAGIVDPATYIASTRKDTTPIKLGEGDKLVQPGTYKELASNPKQPTPTDVGKLLAEFNALSPNDPRRATYLDAIKKATTHQPPVSIANYGSPVPVQLPDGSTALVQPSNKSGAPPQLMTLPGSNVPLRPAKDPAAPKDLTEAQAKATAFLGQMRGATKELGAIGMDQSALGSQAEVALAGGPVNSVIGAKAQRVRQAQDQWAEAFLRFKSGAAVTEAEVKRNRETFFPKIGDKPEQIAQKSRARAQAEQDMEIAAGRGAPRLDGGGNVVRTPDGQTHTFPTPEAAAKFKKAAGL
jgi:hypothetical protein